MICWYRREPSLLRIEDNTVKAQSRFRWLAVLAILLIVASVSLEAFSNIKPLKKRQHARRGPAVLWRDPGNIRRRDLFYGPGSKAFAPAPPFRFLKEIKEGSMPKFDVEDARGVKWRVKLGSEAQSETVATRLVWAAGYNAEEAYYFNRVHIDNLPRLSRGQKYEEENGFVRGAKFKPHRKDIERGENWSWNKNPFAKTRELDGLKTMMIMLNNWDDLKRNNKVLYATDSKTNRSEARYVVTDLGGTLGRTAGLGGGRSKNDLKGFQSERFVRGIDKKGVVKFNYPVRPTRLGLLSIFYPPLFFREQRRAKSMRGIRVENAAWIGSQLSKLSDAQLRDSFRAAGYDRATTEAYVRTLRSRINQLNRLSQSQLASRPRRVR